MNQPLAALASPDPSLTMAHSWHTQSEFDTFLAHQHFGLIVTSLPLSYTGVPRTRAVRRASLAAKRRYDPSQPQSGARALVRPLFLGSLDFITARSSRILPYQRPLPLTRPHIYRN